MALRRRRKRRRAHRCPLRVRSLGTVLVADTGVLDDVSFGVVAPFLVATRGTGPAGTKAFDRPAEPGPATGGIGHHPRTPEQVALDRVFGGARCRPRVPLTILLERRRDPGLYVEEVWCGAGRVHALPGPA